MIVVDSFALRMIAPLDRKSDDTQYDQNILSGFPACVCLKKAEQVVSIVHCSILWYSEELISVKPKSVVFITPLSSNTL